MEFSRQECWSQLPFPSPLDHICQTSPRWPVHLGWPHTAWLSFIALDKVWSTASGFGVGSQRKPRGCTHQAARRRQHVWQAEVSACASCWGCQCGPAQLVGQGPCWRGGLLGPWHAPVSVGHLATWGSPVPGVLYVWTHPHTEDLVWRKNVKYLTLYWLSLMW